MWWFELPASPYISLTMVVDFEPALAYLERLEGDRADKVSIHHLLVAAIARTMAAFPAANARIAGSRIIREPHVGVGMPVDMSRMPGAGREVGLAIVERAETLSLREIAQAARGRVREEKEGRNANVMVRAVMQAFQRVPYPVVARGLDLLDRASKRRWVADQMFRRAPVTTVVSNVGGPIEYVEGALFRGGAIQPSQRLFHVGTVWGVSPLQKEMMAIDGQPQMRWAMPLILVFDHRLFDGVAAGRLLLHLTRLLRDPEGTFGPIEAS